MKELKKFIVIEGGCRGQIDYIEVKESVDSLEEYCEHIDNENRNYFRECFELDVEVEEGDDVEEMFEEFLEDNLVGGLVFEESEKWGKIGCVGLNEEIYVFVVKYNEELESLLGEELEMMYDVEKILGI